MSHSERLDNLTARMEAREQIEGSSTELATMKVDITTLQVNVDQLRFKDIYMLWGEVTLPDVPKFVPTFEP